MKEEKKNKLTGEQLGEVAGGLLDRENNYMYYEGLVIDVDEEKALVIIDRAGVTEFSECRYDRSLYLTHRLLPDSRVRVRWPDRYVYMVI